MKFYSRKFLPPQFASNSRNMLVMNICDVVDATLLEKVKSSIERNKSLQILDICTEHDNVVEAVLKGARGNT